VNDRGPAIAVSGVSKHFRIYRSRETTLKETILSRRRGVYEEFTAVDNVSFEVPTGEALGIFGRNGSGKSTILKMLARILSPDAGTIEVKGRVAALLEVGAGFHPEYSATENIFLSGAIYGMSRQELTPRVDEIIAFAQLERFADNPVKTYSSGMYARLGFSIAVNVDPDVLLVDEVLAVGDESFRSRCYERMLAFREAGKTLILVTHDLGAIASFCSRVHHASVRAGGNRRGGALVGATGCGRTWAGHVASADQRHCADQPQLDEHHGRGRH
jgi:ABC-2 type transport system ATP-binding protein